MRELTRAVSFRPWLLIAVVLTVVTHIAHLSDPFIYAHGWISAHFATMGRAFAEQGIAALGGVPVQNNSPLGVSPDYYIHWPPLFPMLLGVIFRSFGATETTAHATMLILLLTNAVALYALVRTCLGSQAAALAAFAFLLLPVTVAHAHLVLHLHLALFFMLLALLAYVRASAGARINRGWAVIGSAALALAVWSSWEPIMLPPALIAIAFWQRNWAARSLAWLYGAVAGLSAGSVLLLFYLRCPRLLNELLRTFLYRAGLSDYRIPAFDVHLLINQNTYADPPPTLVDLVLNYSTGLWSLGPTVLAACVWIGVVAWKSRTSRAAGSAATLFVGLAGPPLLWCLLMSRHVFYHSYEMILAAPFAAAALALAATRLLAAASQLKGRFTRVAAHWGTRGLLPLALLLHSGWVMEREVRNGRWRGYRASEDERSRALAGEVRAATSAGAVVMMPYDSMVPVYYSERHVIRSVKDDRTAERTAAELNRLFPGSPIFLAIDRSQAATFPESLRLHQIAMQSEHSLLLKFNP